jgi:hypothetical protein
MQCHYALTYYINGWKGRDVLPDEIKFNSEGKPTTPWTLIDPNAPRSRENVRATLPEEIALPVCWEDGSDWPVKITITSRKASDPDYLRFSNAWKNPPAAPAPDTAFEEHILGKRSSSNE